VAMYFDAGRRQFAMMASRLQSSRLDGSASLARVRHTSSGGVAEVEQSLPPLHRGPPAYRASCASRRRGGEYVLTRSRHSLTPWCFSKGRHPMNTRLQRMVPSVHLLPLRRRLRLQLLDRVQDAVPVRCA